MRKERERIIRDGKQKTNSRKYRRAYEMEKEEEKQQEEGSERNMSGE